MSCTKPFLKQPYVINKFITYVESLLGIHKSEFCCIFYYLSSTLNIYGNIVGTDVYINP